MLNEKLQDWLNRTGTSRQQLADQLHVSRRTVESWLGRKHRPIPAAKVSTIERLIAPASAPGHIAVDFTFTEAEWEEITRGIPDGVDKEEAIKAKLLAFMRAARLP